MNETLKYQQKLSRYVLELSLKITLSCKISFLASWSIRVSLDTVNSATCLQEVAALREIQLFYE